MPAGRRFKRQPGASVSCFWTESSAANFRQRDKEKA